MAITYKANGVLFEPKFGSITIKKELDHRGSSLTLTTEAGLQEWDEIEVKDGAEILFAGVIEKVSISSRGGDHIEKKIFSSGYKRLFDRKKIVFRYENITAGDIVRDIITNWTEDFTEGTIEDGELFESAPFNYKTPSEAISQIASNIGFLWKIDNEKRVSFYLRTKNPAPQIISDDSGNFRNLKIIPDVSELTNSVVVRGGTYLSSQQEIKYQGDGEQTTFFTPEKPKEVEVWVRHGTGGTPTQETLGIKFGDNAPTTDWTVDAANKTIANGTHAVLGNSDAIIIKYKYDVPLRIKKRNLSSIAAMKEIFPDTDGVFEAPPIIDETLDSRELAKKVADEHLSLFSNPTIKGSFITYEKVFEPGQVVSIDAKGISNSAVIERVSAKSIANGTFEYTISFATVLFDFEDFLRMLLTRGELDLNEGETVETIENIEDGIGFSETLKVTVDENRVTDTLGFSESLHIEKNFPVEYVLAPYFPASHSDQKRVFILDASPLS